MDKGNAFGLEFKILQIVFSYPVVLIDKLYNSGIRNHSQFCGLYPEEMTEHLIILVFIYNEMLIATPFNRKQNTPRILIERKKIFVL